MTALQVRPRLLNSADTEKVRALLDEAPILNCVVASRVAAVPALEPSRLGGQLWGVEDDRSRTLRSAIYHGGNLIPVGTDLAALTHTAEMISHHGRNCSSIVGPAAAVSAIWPVLSRGWGTARIVRERQPLLITRQVPERLTDVGVRPVEPGELECFLPAAVSMFTEELQISPLGHDLGAAYRSRVADLIKAGRSFARFDRDGSVEFKAEIGALSADTAQIQGVWVRPDLRGRGLGAAGMAQVVAFALQQAPSVSLYVNEFNTAARRMYDGLGFRHVETLSTVLF